MNLELIVATSINNVIGIDNTIPWYIPDDLKRFKQITENHIVIMGRNTFESLPNGKLKNRINIVLTTDYINYNKTNTDTDIIYTDFTNLQEIIDNLREIYNKKKLFVIGGSEIYNLLYNKCKILHLTIIYNYIEGDTYLPFNIKELYKNYVITYESELFTTDDKLRYKFVTYTKIF